MLNDEIKSRSVEDILFISMDSVSSLEEGAKSIFKDVVDQRCIVHLIRNSVKYVPSKDYKKLQLNIRSLQFKGGRGRIRAFQTGMESIQGCRRRVGSKLAACRSTD